MNSFIIKLSVNFELNEHLLENIKFLCSRNVNFDSQFEKIHIYYI